MTVALDDARRANDEPAGGACKWSSDRREREQKCNERWMENSSRHACIVAPKSALRKCNSVLLHLLVRSLCFVWGGSSAV